MIRLGVNVDHIATLRQARRSSEPDPVHAAVIAEQAGADSIVCHLREDRRHVQDRDLKLLRQVVKTRLNLEMAMSEEIIKIAIQVHPDQITIVPEKRQEVTTEGGLDVKANLARLRKVIKMFHSEKIDVSLFINPERRDIEMSCDAGAKTVEIHTGHYANAKTQSDQKNELDRIQKSFAIAKNLKFYVAAGHGLDYKNVQPIARLTQVQELNIGFSIISRAVFVGLEKAVREMKALLS
jgi:pyridoxine 5-phosphate synthase